MKPRMKLSVSQDVNSDMNQSANRNIKRVQKHSKSLFILFLLSVVICMLSACEKEVFTKNEAQKDKVQKDIVDIKKRGSEVQNNGVELQKDKVQNEVETIENNGGQFVKVNDRIYFRKILEKDIGYVYLGNQYAQGAIKPVYSELGYITEEDKHFVPLFEIRADGKLFYMNGAFYLSKKEGERNIIYKTDQKGEKKQDLTEGNPACVYPENNIFVTYDHEKIKIFKNDEMFKEIEMQGNILYFHKLIGEDAIFSLYTNEMGQNSLKIFALNLKTLEMLHLGTIIKKIDINRFPIEIMADRVEKIGDKLCVRVMYMPSPTGILSGYELFSMDLNEENTIISCVTVPFDQIREYDENSGPSICMTDGKIRFCQMAADELFADEDGVFYNDTGRNIHTLENRKTHSIYSIQYRNENIENSYFPEIIEKIGEKIYFVLDKRMTYHNRLISMEYFCYDMKKKELIPLFESIVNSSFQYAYLWVDEKNPNSREILYKMVDVIYLKDGEDQSLLICLGGFRELDEEENQHRIKDLSYYEVFHLNKFAEKAVAADCFVFQEKEANSDFQHFYQKMKKVGAITCFNRKKYGFEPPETHGKKLKLYLAKIYFDPVSDEIIRVEELEHSYD